MGLLYLFTFKKNQKTSLCDVTRGRPKASEHLHQQAKLTEQLFHFALIRASNIFKRAPRPDVGRVAKRGYPIKG